VVSGERPNDRGQVLAVSPILPAGLTLYRQRGQLQPVDTELGSLIQRCQILCS
jgi:hypothetical protein